MLSNRIRILDFDNSLIRQKNLIRKFHPEIIDLKDIAPFCRHWMSQKVAGAIAGYLDPSFQNAITFMGSGDFHQISNLLISQFQEPLSVIVFDHHPDWDIFLPKLGCGSWVSRILEKPNIMKVILLGVSSDDIAGPGIRSANLQALKKDRLEIYPYKHNPTRVFGKKIPENISIRIKKRLLYCDIFWQELKDNLQARLQDIINRIPTPKVYISIDKDCLKPDYSLTNWEEGFLNLDELLTALKAIKDKFDIVGLDITGDYSKPKLSNIIKKIAFKFDHPKNYTAKGKSQDLIDAVNENTNIIILESLLGRIPA